MKFGVGGIQSNWKQSSTGLSNGLAQTSDKPLPESVMTLIYASSGLDVVMICDNLTVHEHITCYKYKFPLLKSGLS